ncbi:MAG: ABC transporter ATP-binding protein [Clostridiales bacterium]|nr:ABC transporter ATP-binding protein [Clostridiales bacterium]
MRYLFRFIKPYKKTVLLLMLLYALQTVAALFMPFVMGNIVEYGIRVENLNYILQEGAIMVALAVGALSCAMLTNRINSNFSATLAVDIRKQVFNKVNTLSFEQFSELGTGSLITRTTDDVSWIEDTISQLPYVVIAAPIMFIGGVALSFKGDWVLPLILLGVSVLVLVISTLITGSLEKHWQRGEEFTDVQNRVVRERLSGIRVVRAFDKEQYEHQRARRATSEMCNSFVTANTVSGLVSPIASLLLNVATVAIIYVGAVRLQKVSTLKAGDILATIQYIALIANAVLILSWTISFIPRVKVSLKRIGAILDLQNVREDISLGLELDGDITFDNVSFAYGNAQVNSLTDVSIDIKQGEIVGIIGGTGSGKTTLVKLLMDFYAVKGGERRFGGKSYGELTPATIRDNVAIALQKSMIFEGTIADNVRMGNKDASDEQVRQVLEIAQILDFVDSKEEGVNYKLTQSGNNLSGGQKQRINIARTILKPASVYIFDDSFSALDYLTEANLRKSLNQYLKNKTQIIVTQRAATAMRCDKVYVLDNGKVAGVGTHKQLLKDCPTYKEIYLSQMGGDINE